MGVVSVESVLFSRARVQHVSERDETDSTEPAAESRRPTTRREVLASGAAAATVAVAGCAGGGDGPLTVSTWSGANLTVFEETLKPMYEDETGERLEVVGNWSNILGQIRQSPADDPPFDLTVGSTRDHYLGQQDGLWEPIRRENVPNAERIKPAVLENAGSDTSLPVAYGIMCYAYDDDAVDYEPGEWSDLVDEPAVENVALPGSYFYNAVLMGAIIADEAPMADEVYDPATHDTVFDTLSQIPVTKFYSGATDMWTAISQGVANVGQYFYAYSLARARDDDELNVGVHVPERTFGYADHYQVARGSDNRERAEAFLDFLLREDVQSAYADAFNLGMVNENATHPEATRAEVPLDNDELAENVVFKDFGRVADMATDLNERYRQLQNSF